MEKEFFKYVSGGNDTSLTYQMSVGSLATAATVMLLRCYNSLSSEESKRFFKECIKDAVSHEFCFCNPGEVEKKVDKAILELVNKSLKKENKPTEINLEINSDIENFLKKRLGDTINESFGK